MKPLAEYGISEEVPDADPAAVPRAENDPWIPLVQDGADILTERLSPIVEIVKGIVTEQSKLVIGSGSKTFKTWLTMDMALSISQGVRFLGRDTTRRRVLYVNLELKPGTFTRRLQAIASAKMISVDRKWFFHLPLRGRLAGMDVHEIISRYIRFCRHLAIGVIVLDPLYKLNIAGEENSSRDMTVFFNELDRLTTEAECTVLLNDHFSKGNQSEKDPLDAIRGSSAKGGDVDAAMVLRKHEVEGAFRVDMVHRDLPPVEPFVVGWEFPLMRLRADLSPDAMKKAKAGRKPGHSAQKTPLPRIQ
jgi:RecA-family ATPase